MSRYFTVVVSRTGNVRPETSKGHPVSLGWPFQTETLVTSSEEKPPKGTAGIETDAGRKLETPITITPC